MTKVAQTRRERERQERERAAREELDTAPWAEAQRAAAQALDAREYALRRVGGEFPHRVDEPLSELLVDIHRMTECTVMMGAFGNAPFVPVPGAHDWKALGLALREDVRGPMDAILRAAGGIGGKVTSARDRTAFAREMARWTHAGSQAMWHTEMSEEDRVYPAFVHDLARISALAECGSHYAWFGRSAALGVADVLGWLLEKLMLDETPAPFYDVARTDEMKAILPRTTHTRDRPYKFACQLIESMQPSASSPYGIAMERGGAAFLAASLLADLYIKMVDPSKGEERRGYAEALREAWSMALHPKGPKGSDKGDGTIKAETNKAVRAALRLLGHDPDEATSSIDKKNSRGKPHTRKAEAKRNAAARARARPTKAAK